jgi:hypothetical protein
MESEMSSESHPLGAAFSAAPPELRDAVANASYEYDEALLDYEDAIVSRDAAKRGEAEARLRECGRRLSAAQAALVATRTTGVTRVGFSDLLADPTQQLDPGGLVLASVWRYQMAPQTTASGTAWWDKATPAVKASLYANAKVAASTAVATAC